MILDYNPATRAFILRVPRGEEPSPQRLMREYGFDFSSPASTPQVATLYTREPYAAATFANVGTPAALSQLAPIIRNIEHSWTLHSDSHIKVPDDQELAPYEKAAVEYALSRRNTLLGDEPGAGKTIEAIAFCNEVNAKQVTVICPASIRYQWADKIKEWSTMARPYHRHVITSAKRGVHPTAAWTILSYEMARTPAIAKALAKRKPDDVLILDEAHYLKTINSRRTRAIFGGGQDREFAPLADRCGSILALTGTPLPNRPREAYTLARGLCFDAIDWMSEDAFKERFNPSRRIALPNGKIAVDERSGRHAEMQNRLRANFMVRRLKADFFPQRILPVYDLVHATESGAVKQALEAERLLDIDPEVFDAEAIPFDKQAAIATVRRLMGVALAPQVAEYVRMLLDGGEDKIVVFGHHVQVLDILQQKLDKWGVVRVDGRTTAAGKAAAVAQFQKNPTIKVILGNILSLGTGTDGMQNVCNHAVIAEPSWVPYDNVQCFDRLDRGGQRRQVFGEIVIAPGSFAERVLATALRKMHPIHSALDRRVA